MAGSVDSSWYFLRFADPHNVTAAWTRPSPTTGCDRHVHRWARACRRALALLSLLHQVLHELGLISVDEPAAALRNQGMLNAFTPVLSGTDKAIKPASL